MEDEKLQRQVETHPYPLVFATISGTHTDHSSSSATSTRPARMRVPIAPPTNTSNAMVTDFDIGGKLPDDAAQTSHSADTVASATGSLWPANTRLTFDRMAPMRGIGLPL